MKRFVLGFIIGGVICSALTGFAVEYAVTANPFPVKVNGVETPIEGYNINDNTYFKLRDVADAVGGFTVGFADNTITIDTPQIEPPEPSETPTASVAKSEISKILREIPTQNVNGIEYVKDIDIENALKGIGIKKYTFGTTSLIDTDLKKKVVTDVPRTAKDVQLIEADFYYSTIIPYIVSH